MISTKSFCFVVLIEVYLTVVDTIETYSITDHHACNFMDSINITNGVLFPENQSISYDGNAYDRQQYSTFDFRLINGTVRESVSPHLRGCPCLKRSCIRLFCPPAYDSTNCSKYFNKFSNITLDIMDAQNGTENVKLFDYFAYVYDRPCHYFFEEDKWTLTHVRILFHLQSYCFLFFQIDYTMEKRLVISSFLILSHFEIDFFAIFFFIYFYVHFVLLPFNWNMVLHA